MSEMPNQKVILRFADGTIGVMSFALSPQIAPNSKTFPPGYNPKTGQREANDAAIQHDINKTDWGGNSVVSWRRIKDDAIPHDRTFRNAWVDTGTINTDMPKARDIWRVNMRVARQPILDALDVQYIRADERGDQQAKLTITAQKQALRDVTADPAIEAAQAPELLKTVWPTILGPSPVTTQEAPLLKTVQ